MKDILTEWGNVPIKAVSNAVEDFTCDLIRNDFSITKAVIFIDCREPEEIGKLKKIYKAKTVLIRRESAEEVPASNHADANVLKFDYDIILWNNNSIEDFFNAIDIFMKGENLNA